MYRLYYIVVQSWSKDGQKIGINKPKQTEMRNGESFLTQYVFNVQTWFFFHCQIARNFTGSRLLPQSQTSIPKVHGVWSFCFVWKPHITAFFVHYISHASIVYIYIRQRPAYPANFPMASNSGYLPLFNRPIVVAVVVVVVLVSKSHPKPLLGIWIIRLSGQLQKRTSQTSLQDDHPRPEDAVSMNKNKMRGGRLKNCDVSNVVPVKTRKWDDLLQWSGKIATVIVITGWWWLEHECFFPYIGNVIIPTDELHHFSEG